MDTLDIRNLQLSYQAIYDEVLCESMEDLGIIGEIEEERAPGVKPYRPGPTQAEVRADAARARKKHLEKSKGQKGYGDKVGSSPELTRRPDAETAEWLRQHPAKDARITGEMGREWGSRAAAGVTRAVRGPGEPQAVTLPREKKKPKMVKKDGKWVKEALDYYDMILEYLLDEGYAETVENAEAIMVNMSEEWVGDIVEEFLDEELTGERKKRALKKGFKHLATAKEGSSSTKNVDKNMPTRRGGGSGIKRNPNRWGRPGTVKPGPAILNPNPDQGSGNRTARRAGKKVKDNEDRYYWNDKDENF